MKKIAIIGLGLIGGSIAKGLAKSNSENNYKIVAYNRNGKSAQVALKEGVIQAVAKTPAEAVQGADIVIISTPPSTYEDIAHEIAEALENGAVVTDVGSIKTHAVFTIYKHMPPGVEFVPSHPIAGSEKTGYEAAQADLFKGKKTVITPLPKNSPAAIMKIQNLWAELGSKVEKMTPAEHDKIYALVSHVPQLLACAYSMAIRHKKFGAEVKIEGELAAALRIANSSSEMWADIFMLNSVHIHKFLEKMFNGLNHIEKFSELIDYRERLGGNEKKLGKLPTDKKIAAATVVFPTLLGNLLLFCIDEEMSTNLGKEFSAGAIHQSLAMIENEVKSKAEPKNFEDYAGTGLRDFTNFSLYDVSAAVKSYGEEIHLLKMLVHRKIFEITAAVESGSRDHLISKLAEAKF